MKKDPVLGEPTFSESMMSTRRSNDKAFEFLKTEDQENLLEWEANQEEIDR